MNADLTTREELIGCAICAVFVAAFVGVLIGIGWFFIHVVGWGHW